jgi:aryl carrier-like protein
MYRSGDLVRHLPSGDIEFIGRIDNQIKYRGFRIELGEIESVILDYTSVNNAIVLLREDENKPKQLVAYIIPKACMDINQGDLRTFMRRKLPEYMVPVSFIVLENYPLTPSNKVDIKALPLPSEENLKQSVEFVAPRDETEMLMAEVGSELLGIEKMGVFDNFFELGGHSLLATQFVSRIKSRLKKEITLKMLFEHPTIAELAEELASVGVRSDADENIIRSEDRGDADLSDLINQIENMSDTEAKELLDKDENRKG